MIRFRKEKGTVAGVERVVDAFRQRLTLCKNGDYDVVIKPHESKRSLNQNRLMWLWFRCIEAETGTPQQDIHDYYCAKFLQRPVTVGNYTTYVSGGTSKLSEKAFAAFLDYVQADAASEFGITLPNPDDEAWEYFYNVYSDN